MTESWESLGGQPAPPETENLRNQFGAALPTNVRTRVHPTAIIDMYLKRAVANGWTTKELAQECSRDLGTAGNVGAIVTSRLGNCANTTRHTHSGSKPLPVWCGRCADNAFRWEVDADDLPVRPCPRCSPAGT